ncbi:MAG TPA: alcohol dehydrogenase catalytic domain-containing protein [Arsenicitalea sp.]|jgi:threonine dehydrogenase-like Zn-dependent dehydrogenase|nr:alcohol dehydrogenase catalytic domain-containing protein [Arsenicitalea sp.]
MGTMKQAILVDRKKFEMRDVAIPTTGSDEVLVKVRASGVCASELHAWQDGEDAPVALGHEVAGDIVAVGSNVTGFKVGDRVTGLFGEGFADYAVEKADRVLHIPEAIPLESAFGEPLACAVSAARRTHVELGDRIAIVGLGFMGLLMLQLLQLKGPSEVLGIDLREEALQRGKHFGCDIALTPSQLPHHAHLAQFDVVVEATGTQEGLSLATELVRQHGVLSILGYHQGGPREVDMKLWNFKAIEVLNAHERRADFRMDCMRRGLALAAAGKLDLQYLTTNSYGLDQVGDAFSDLASKPAGFIKAVLVSGPETDNPLSRIPDF